MFVYVADETPKYMPLSLVTKPGAHLLEVRKNSTYDWLRPDGKTQVTVKYYNDNGVMVLVQVDTILISIQHDETVDNDQIVVDLKERVHEGPFLEDLSIRVPTKKPSLALLSSASRTSDSSGLSDDNNWSNVTSSVIKPPKRK